jgi:hypothetical protein
MLTRLAPGVADSSDLHFARPMDNGNMAGITVNGAQGGNEFTLDGAPNRVSPGATNAGATTTASSASRRRPRRSRSSASRRTPSTRRPGRPRRDRELWR